MDAATIVPRPNPPPIVITLSVGTVPLETSCMSNTKNALAGVFHQTAKTNTESVLALVNQLVGCNPRHHGAQFTAYLFDF